MHEYEFKFPVHHYGKVLKNAYGNQIAQEDAALAALMYPSPIVWNLLLSSVEIWSPSDGIKVCRYRTGKSGTISIIDKNECISFAMKVYKTAAKESMIWMMVRLMWLLILSWLGCSKMI